MRIHLLLCGGLLAACATNSHPSNEEEGGGAGDIKTSSGSGAETPDEEPAPLIAVPLYEPARCDDNSLRFYGYALDAGSIVPDVVCHWDFGDGTTGDGCIIEHPFPSVVNVTLTVYDPVSGATGSYEETGVIGPPSFDASLDVIGSGLAIAWHAEARPYVSSLRISIEPADKVIVNDPSVFSLGDGNVSVTEAGTYTIALDASITIGDFATCAKHVERTVTLGCSPTPEPL